MSEACESCGSEFRTRADVAVHRLDCALTWRDQRNAAAAEAVRLRARVAELEAKLAEAERESVGLRAEISGAHGAMKLCNVPEQIPPFTVPLAPLAARVMHLGHERDTAATEAARLHEHDRKLSALLVEHSNALHRLARTLLARWPAVSEEVKG